MKLVRIEGKLINPETVACIDDYVGKPVDGVPDFKTEVLLVCGDSRFFVADPERVGKALADDIKEMV